jgi:hypothetical protein
MEKPTYQAAWKIVPNDYEALELNACALANLSAFTTFTQLFSQETENNLAELSKMMTLNTSNNKQNDLSLNNNELISRSAKITQELEIKLKERRKLLESVCGKDEENEFKSNNEWVFYFIP